MAEFLGIEIGGTKLQLGIGDGLSRDLLALERRAIDASAGAEGILHSIQSATGDLLTRYRPTRVGIGFGGPVNAQTGVVTTSHQVAGWDGFPFLAWIGDQFNLPAVIGNDCDCAALAESRFGAGQSFGSMAYVTVGTGIGGGLVLQGQLHGSGRPAVAEIGHLRPGPGATSESCTIESVASGWGIAHVARTLAHCVLEPAAAEPNRSDAWTVWLLELAAQIWRQQSADTEEEVVSVPWTQQHPTISERWLAAAHDWHHRFDASFERLTAKEVADDASAKHPIAEFTLQLATHVLGWGVAQLITLTGVECVVVGGGVSLMEPHLFMEPLRTATANYVFGPLQGSYALVPAALGEEVVVHGAIALASDASGSSKKTH